MLHFFIWEIAFFLCAKIITDRLTISHYVGTLPAIISIKLFLSVFIAQAAIILSLTAQTNFTIITLIILSGSLFIYYKTYKDTGGEEKHSQSELGQISLFGSKV